MGGDRQGPAFQTIHELEELPGVVGVGLKPLGPISLPELLDLVAALSGGLGKLVEAAACGDGNSHLLPLAGLELAAIEGVPLLLVRLDEIDGLLRGPGEGVWLFGEGG